MNKKRYVLLFVIFVGLFAFSSGSVFANTNIEQKQENSFVNSEVGYEEQYKLMFDDYTEISLWTDKSEPPKAETGEIIENGWVKYKDTYYKIENSKITKESSFGPCNFDCSKGTGNLTISVNCDIEEFGKLVGVTIDSPEEGVVIDKYISKENGYSIVVQKIPAGLYYVLNVYDGNSLYKSPIDEIVEYPLKFYVKAETENVLNIDIIKYTRPLDYSKIHKDIERSIEEESQHNNTLNLEYPETERNNDKAILSQEKKQISLFLNIILVIILLGLGVAAYKIYNYIK